MAEPEKRLCAECGKELPEGSEFCSECGTDIRNTAVDGVSDDQTSTPAASTSKGSPKDASEQQEVLAEFTGAENPYASEPPIDPKRSHRSLIVGVVILVIAVAVAIAVAIIVHNKIVESEGGPSSEIVQVNPMKAIEQFEEE